MPSIKDVAKLAGVSIATVSHVVNNTRFVSEKTAQRVRTAMEELSYRPNIAALSLRTKKTRTIGLAIPLMMDETSNVFFMQLALGVESELMKNGFFTFLSNTNENLGSEIAEVRNLVERQIDGLIIAPCMEDQSPIQQIVGDSCQIVYVDRVPMGINNFDCVLSDSEQGCFDAVSRQIEMGHRDIGIICGHLKTTANAAERLGGYKRALAAHGLPFDENLVIEGACQLSEGYTLAQRLLSRSSITALLITNNCHALGTLQYLRKQAISVPDQLNITVFDDYDWSSVSNPPVSAIRQYAYEMGKKAAQVLLRRMNAEQKRGKIYKIQTEIVERASWSKRT